MAWVTRILVCLTLGLSASAFAGPLPAAHVEFPPQNAAEVKLGQLLFYDRILSGNRNISCADCHHPRFATSDGVSLGLGEGADGLGPDRTPSVDNPPEQRIPRNAPALFNLGAPEFAVMFHDGRLEVDADRPSGIRSPLEDEMVRGFDSVLAAQTMFPVLSADEMAGHYSENEVSRAVRQGLITGPDGAWALIATRVEDNDEYRALFDDVIGVDAAVMFTDVANALGAFIAAEWRADDSPFDRYLKGETSLEPAQARGMALFFGKAGCDACHSGLFQTDHRFHATAMPQIGPGKAARFESHNRDVGRMRVTGRAEDAYAFRTPSLRNVAKTAPYGHVGAYATLDAVVRHHLDPASALRSYNPGQAILPGEAAETDFSLMGDEVEVDRIAAANALAPMSLSDADIADIISFLHALTDETSLSGRLGIPKRVPSELPVN